MRVAWNKGLTKETDKRVLKNAKAVKKHYNENKEKYRGRKHTPETIAKLKKNAGGARKGAGRGKGGWYSGIWCDSTYELVWLIYNLDRGEAVTRNLNGYRYMWEGVEHRYYPDFILNETLYEIKGYETEKDREKYKAVEDRVLIILSKKDLNKEFRYVRESYAYQTLTNLYDQSKFKYDVKWQSSKDLCKCGKLKFKTAQQCISCPRPKKIEWGSLDSLIEMVESFGYKETGRILGVTDNSVRKHIIRQKKLIKERKVRYFQ